MSETPTTVPVQAEVAAAETKPVLATLEQFELRIIHGMLAEKENLEKALNGFMTHVCQKYGIDFKDADVNLLNGDITKHDNTLKRIAETVQTALASDK